MAWPTAESVSWETFQYHAARLTDHRPSEYGVLFRGQSNKQWSLKHSLARCLPSDIHPEGAIHIEQEALKRFQSNAAVVITTGHIPDRYDLPGWWAIMQHHYAPTRLLDWTRSPYVALYFAVIDNPDVDGAVWMVNGGALMTRVDETEKLPASAERKAFENFFQTDTKSETIFTLDVHRRTQRMIAQQGMFTVSRAILGRHDLIIEETLSSDPKAFGIYIIKKDDKLKLLRRLETMNITASSLFPGIDGLGRSIGEFIKVDSAYEVGRANRPEALA